MPLDDTVAETSTSHGDLSKDMVTEPRTKTQECPSWTEMDTKSPSSYLASPQTTSFLDKYNIKAKPLAENCIICLEPSQDRLLAPLLCCGNAMHAECKREWEQQSIKPLKCAICRTAVDESNVKHLEGQFAKETGHFDVFFLNEQEESDRIAEENERHALRLRFRQEARATRRQYRNDDRFLQHRRGPRDEEWVRTLSPEELATTYIRTRLRDYPQEQKDKVDVTTWEAIRAWLSDWPSRRRGLELPLPTDESLIPTYTFLKRTLPRRQRQVWCVRDDDVGLAANVLLAMGLSTNIHNPILESRRFWEACIPLARASSDGP